MMEMLKPDARDIDLIYRGTISDCPICHRGASVFNQVNCKTGIYRGTVHCSDCGLQIGANAKSREDGLTQALARWERLPRGAGAPVPSLSPNVYASLEHMQAWAASIMARPCDFPIGGRANPYLERWWIIPRNEQQNVYLHRILRDDDDRALHDHPWANASYVIAGRYCEITPDGDFIRQPGDYVTREPTDRHRLELIDGEPCVSLFVTGPKLREWGFDCPKGWVHWKDFTAGDNGELVGRGCGEMA